MEIIILAGNSLHNKEWAEELADNLASFGNCFVFNYHHWKTGEKNINFEYELAKLVEKTKDLQEYILVGKSAGAILISLAMSKGMVNPRKCVLMGLPFKFAENNGKDLKEAILSSNVRREFIQNKNDPYGSAKEVKEILGSLKIKNYSFTETDGDTHDYTDFDKIIELIRK